MAFVSAFEIHGESVVNGIDPDSSACSVKRFAPCHSPAPRVFYKFSGALPGDSRRRGGRDGRRYPRTVMTIKTMGSLLLATVLVSACDQVPLFPSRGPAFDQIGVGTTTRTEVFVLMGRTSNRRLYNLAGVELECLTYHDVGADYAIKIGATPFSAPVVIAKSVTPRLERTE